jgi:hypothetical protein
MGDAALNGSGGGLGGGLGSGFGGADFGSGFGSSFGGGFGGGYRFDESGANAANAAASAPSRFRYQPAGASGAGEQSGFSRPPGGGGGAMAAAAGAAQGGFGALASLLATSPFLATMLGKFGKKRGEE